MPASTRAAWAAQERSPANGGELREAVQSRAGRRLSASGNGQLPKEGVGPFDLEAS